MRLYRCGLGDLWPSGRFRLGRRALVLAAVVATAGTLALAYGHGGAAQTSSSAAVANTAAHPSIVPVKISGQTLEQERARKDFAALPLVFEKNEGQTNPRVEYLARGNGYGLFLTRTGAVLSLHAGLRASVVRMKLAGQGAGAVKGENLLPGKSNYLIGNNPAKWRRNVPQFAQVRYSGIYPGVDLIFYGKQGQLEYDFQVAPGADAQQIALQLDGYEELKLTSAGDLVIATNTGDVRLQAPKLYQEVENRKKPVSGRFVLRSSNEVGFEIGAYDHSRALVIDPSLSYSTYLGGTGNEACSAITGTGVPVSGCPAITVDAVPYIYIAGSTTSADFPVSASGALQPTLAAGATANVFVTKLNPGASGAAQLVFSTYLGGNGTDTPAGIAIAPGTNVVVAGTTSSANFPAQTGFQTAPKAAGNHAFVTELDSAGGSILYSTYLSSSGNDVTSGLALDISGNAYVTGVTTSTQHDFPITVGALQPTALADQQFFLSKIKLNPIVTGQNSLAYSTYFGGGNPSNGVAVGGGIAVDSSGNVYITGGTNFLNTQSSPQNGGGTDFPILNAAQVCLGHPENPTTCPTNLTTMDAFVAKINPAAAVGGQLLYSTYFGGTGDEVGYGIAVDSGGSAYITGSTTSPSSTATSVVAGTIIIPSGATPLQSCLDGPTNPSPCPTSPTAPDAFVAKYANPTVTTATSTPTTLTYFSYLGGSANDVGTAIQVDSIGGAYITGWTNSTDLPVQNAVTGSAAAGGTDAFVARLDTTATTTNVGTVDSSGYLGGAGNDAGTAIVLDSSSANLYLAGETASANFPTANPFQAALSGPSDDFVTVLSPNINLGVVETVSPSPVGVGSEVTFTYTITNNGDLTSGITFNDSYPAVNATYDSATAPGGSCSNTTNAGSGTGNVTCLVGTMAPGGTATVTVILTPTTAVPLSDSGRLTVQGRSQTFAPSPPATASVNDFAITAAPTTATTFAGVPASYTIYVNPTPGTSFPSSISLSCSGGLPTQGTCSFTTNPLPNLVGTASSSLVINTTARTTTTTQLLRRGKLFYAGWLPIFGLTLAGAGLGGMSRKRKLLMGLFFGALITLMLFLGGCGSSGSTTTTTGTPAGTYNVTITGTSGGATRTTVISLTVQ